MVPRPVPMELWGKDHWSTLLYLECCAVDRKGQIDPARMRCDIDRHPGLSIPGPLGRVNPTKYPTMLKGMELLEDHDDWDCFIDAEAAGLVAWDGTGVNPVVRFTEKGLQVTAALRAHKTKGGQCSNFVMGEKMTGKKGIDEIQCIGEMERRECKYWDLRGLPSKKKRRGTYDIEFKNPTRIRRVAIEGDLNLCSVVLHPCPPNEDHFTIGMNIRTKQGWDSGNFHPILALGISLVGRRRQKGKRSHPSKVKEIVILKETSTRK